MIRGREIKNLPLIDVTSGTVLGTVWDLLLADNQQLKGLAFVTNDQKLRFLPREQVVNLGRDAVLVKGDQESFPLVTETGDHLQPAGTWVMTAEGKSLGTIDDIVVEDNGGSIVGYEISDGYLMDLLVGRKVVTAANILTQGKDAIIVDEDF